MVLGASNSTYAEATYTQKLPDFVGATNRGFEDFGGVPEVIVPDQLRPQTTNAVVAPAEVYDGGGIDLYAEVNSTRVGLRMLPEAGL